MKKVKQAGWKSAARNLLIMTAGALGLTLVLAWLVSMEIIPESAGKTISFCLIETFMFILFWITAKQTPQKKLISTVLTAGVFICIRLFGGTILQNNISISAVKPFLSLAIASAAGALAAFEKKPRW